MASITVTGFDDVIKKLEKLSKKTEVDNAAKKAVNAAKGIVADSMKASISASEYGPRSTGSAAASVSATEAKVNSYGVYSVARPTGRDSEGKRNGEKAAYLEYGTPTLAARPWRARAVSSADAKAVKIIEDTLRTEFETD